MNHKGTSIIPTINGAHTYKVDNDLGLEYKNKSNKLLEC